MASWFPSIPSVPAWIQRQRLSSASQSGDLETVQKLIDSTNANLPDAWGNTPLHNGKAITLNSNSPIQAAWKGFSDIIEFILCKPELGAEVNFRDSENHTPLMLAAASGGAPETEGISFHSEQLIDF